ncbi:hypothetical protein GJV85_05890 [Sulfurimonas aquatica]|uniref:histidine kinase n=1 Tax=Sulfurimonas aquatica TaxID=2672570 RepID=A0A975B023_9BACT|nr:sensor histidine kinase [Sulfurimonas aquatica]QSZ41655.1 hypothetical protein GJV85_05890 [Sulfurimonas aquatica]
MFKQIFLLLVSIFLSLNATPLVQINSDELKLKNFSLEYYVDKSNNQTLKEITNQEFKQGVSGLSLGNHENSTWLRFKLKNTTAKNKTIYLHSELAYLTNKIEFYELKNKKLLHTKIIDFINSDYDSNFVYATDALFKISLKKNETKTIYIKNYMRTVQVMNYTLYDEYNSKQRLSKKNIYIILSVGMLLALAIYHLILYLSTRYREYLYYTLYLGSSVLWMSQISGLLATEFEFYYTREHEYYLLFLMFVPIFISLFTKKIFNMPQNYKIENTLLNSVILLFSLSFLIGLYDVILSMYLATLFIIYMFLSLFIVALSMFLKNEPLAFTFLIANSFFSSFALLTDLFYMGVLEYSSFVFNAASIGVLIESILLAFILSYRIKLLQKSELEKSQELISQIQTSREKDKLLFQQNKMVSMGEMIENIAHQWRQPLSQINSSVLLIDDYLYQHSLQNATVEKELSDIESLTTYLSTTIDSFRNFFDPNKKHTHFDLKDIIENALLISNSSTPTNDIDVKISINGKYRYYGLEDELQQVLIILLNNAKDVLINRNIPNPTISIYITNDDKYYMIKVCDNAGGIDEELMDKIFEPYFTTKHKTQGTGLGLYISKLIIEENMLGQIEALNKDDGACFNIKFPLNESKN